MIIEIELLAPTYLGGAYQQPEIRPSSIKGLLRFWFRAFYPDFREKEGMFFGDAGIQGMSPFRLRIRSPSKYRICYIGLQPDATQSPSCIQDKARFRGIDYLTFPYQLKDSKRNAISPRQRITFEHIFSERTVKSSMWGGLKLALITSWWGLAALGGIGARSRRGFGSFMITNTESSWKQTKILSAISEKKEVNSWWAGFTRSLSKILKALGTHHSDDFLTIGSGTKIALVGRNNRGFKQWDSALDFFGVELKRFRSGDTRGVDLRPEEKASFGLPIAGKTLTVEGKEHVRGASPLLVNVIRIGGEYYLLVTLTRSPVLPKGEPLVIEKNGRTRDSAIKRKAVEEFFEVFTSDSLKEKTIS
ncbi:MAG: type III-B CRISPR module RAMP protein Cmr1 [Candidatus Thorarchaeota archaeon]|nr:type III-B CRISPR module RAMP protein Cmr1 [Candidatus Thorarchaeota archaeon]